MDSTLTSPGPTPMSANANLRTETLNGGPTVFHFFFFHLPDLKPVRYNYKEGNFSSGIACSPNTFIYLRKALALNGFPYYIPPVSKPGKDKNHYLLL